MRRRWLRILATYTFRRAWWIMPLVVLLTLAALRRAQDLQFDTALNSFLPPPTAEALLMRELVGDYRKLEPVMVVLRAREPGFERELVPRAMELARWLDDQKFFTTPQLRSEDPLAGPPPHQWLHYLPPEDWDHLPALLERQLLEGRAWRNNALSPTEWFARRELSPDLGRLVRERIAAGRGPARNVEQNGYYLSPDGRALLLLLYPARSPEDGNAALTTLRFTDRIAEFFFDQHPNLRGKIELTFHGGIINTGRHIDKMAEELGIILRFTLPLAFLFHLLVFRKFEAILFIALPPAIGMIWTLGLAQLLFGAVTGVAMMFLVVILAIGVEYTLQLYHRFMLELYRTHLFYRALSRAYTETGRGLLASAMLFAALFLALFLATVGGGESGESLFSVVTRAGGFARLALVLALGLGCNLLACLLALPLMAAIKQMLARGRVRPVPLYRFNLERLYLPAVINPRATLGIMLLIGVVLGFAARELDFARNFAAISPFFYRPADAGDTASEPRDFERAGLPLLAVVSGPTLQAALENNDQLESNLRAVADDFKLHSYDSLRWTLPSLATQRGSLARLRALNLGSLRKELEQTLQRLQYRPALLDPLLANLRQARAAQGVRLIAFNDELPPAMLRVAQRHVIHQHERYFVATIIYPQAAGLEPAIIPALERALALGLRQDEGVRRLTLVGDPVLERELARVIKVNLALLLLLSLVLVALVLWLHFRSLRRALIVFVPMAFALGGVGGGLAVAHVELHFFTVLALPLVLCLALDTSLQITQFYYDRQPISVRLAMNALGRVVVLSAGTMALFFGTWTLTSYPGLRDFGGTLLIAAITVSMSALMLLPALLRLFGRGQSVLSVLLPEADQS